MTDKIEVPRELLEKLRECAHTCDYDHRGEGYRQLVAQADALLREAAQPEPITPKQLGTQHDFCHWTFDDNEFAPVWTGSCGAAWSFIDGGPEENKLRYCPECGKHCVVAKPRYDNNSTPLPERAEG